MPRHPLSVTRRQLLWCAPGLAWASAAGDAFWNTKPPAQWTAGEMYQLMNHSPWAVAVKSRDHSGPSVLEQSMPSDRWGPKCVVTWESAEPVRRARKKALSWLFDGCYVIGVDGMPRSGLGPLYRLRQNAVLRGKNKQKWMARAAIVREIITTSPITVFGFPFKETPIDVEMSEVVFEAYFGKWFVQAKFHPKEMFYQGKPAF